jgi:hypothetical protein
LRAASTVGWSAELLDVEMVEKWAAHLAFKTVCTLVDDKVAARVVRWEAIRL